MRISRIPGKPASISLRARRVNAADDQDKGQGAEHAGGWLLLRRPDGKLDLLFGACAALYFLAPHLKKLGVGSAHITRNLITAAPVPTIGAAPIVGGPAQGGNDRLLAAALPPCSSILVKCAYVA